MQINKYHGDYNRSRRTVAIKYICIHYTATQASALNNCKFFAGGNRKASADYFIDDSGIWEYNDPSSGYYTWAVGDGGGKYGITNSNSINIEVVSDGRNFSESEISYCAELVRSLMNKYGIPASRVVRHYDASRKHCPKPYIAQAHWDGLLARLTQGNGSSWIWDDRGGWWYRHSDGSWTSNGWEWINNAWYYFNANGYMHKGWLDLGGTWYFLRDNGTMISNGWAWINGECYCFASDGSMRTGFIKDGSKWYWCYENGNGKMARNTWVWVNSWNAWFYFYNDGSMASNTWIGNYHVNGDGVWDYSR